MSRFHLRKKPQKREEAHRAYAERSERIHSVSQLLRAYSLFERDVDYVVQDGQILIVDEFTGRILHGRRYSEGLHQALEAKEGVKVAGENQTLATITFQNFFKMYKKIAGMTGTAATEAAEFHEIYKLDVVTIPTNRPMVRKDHQDQIYSTHREKYNAVVKEITEMHEKGQPVLVGTTSIEKSELLSKLLQRAGVEHEVLNAKQHAKEATIVAQAGRLKAVTIATNMAGRGTDIVLGGNFEINGQQRTFQGRHRARRPYARGKAQEIRENVTSSSMEEHEKVMELGGLHIVGTERHESRRIDNQLRGRAGRQGDPGSSKFFPVARRRSHAHIRLRTHRLDHGQAGRRGGRGHFAPDRVAGAIAQCAEAGRGPQLRDPQTPQGIRRCHEPPAHRDLRVASANPHAAKILKEEILDQIAASP